MDINHLVREIFEVSGFNSLVPIAESVKSGIEQLGQPFTNSGVEGFKVQRFTVQGSAQPLAA